MTSKVCVQKYSNGFYDHPPPEGNVNRNGSLVCSSQDSQDMVKEDAVTYRMIEATPTPMQRLVLAGHVKQMADGS